MNDEKLNKALNNVSKMDFSTEDTKEISEKLTQLTEALEASDYNAKKDELIKGSSMMVTDLSEMAAPYLTDIAKAKLAIVSKNITEVIDLDKELVSECIYLSVQVRSDKLEEGVKVIAEQVNLLAAGGYIHSTLAKVSSIQLAHKQGEYQSSAVFAFVHVPSEQASLAKSLCTTAHIEGQIGEPLHSLKVELPPGEFFAFERISVAPNMTSITKVDGDPRLYMDELVKLYLSVLPKGTELVSAERRAIDSLSVPVELRFRSGILDEVKEVQLDWVRKCGTASGEFKEGNVLLAVRYLDKDGKDIYEQARRPL